MPFSKVLLVDDDIDFLRTMGRKLSEKFEIATTPSAEETIQWVRANHWDAVVLDVEMPSMNGFQLLDRLKEIRSDVCYLFLTCLADDETYLRSLRFDPDDFLNKPISPTRLAAAINHRLKKVKSAGVLRFLNIELNVESGLAKIGSEKIELTKKEKLILMGLIRAPGKKVYRDELMESVWQNFAVTYHTLDTHLTNLRRKLSGAGIHIHVDRDRQVCLSES